MKLKICVEHHGRRWNQTKGWWDKDLCRTFASKKAFDNYVLKQTEKYPHQEITYFIYKLEPDGRRGKPLAHLSYNGLRQYSGVRYDDEWLLFK